MKVILRVLVFALVFCMLAKHQASGEKDCHDQKKNVKLKCRKNIDISGFYVRPRVGDKCCQAVDAADMVCVCGAFTEKELEVEKISCIYLFHLQKIVDIQYRLEPNVDVSTLYYCFFLHKSMY